MKKPNIQPDIHKKVQLLKQKILTNATISHNTYQYRIDQLQKQQQAITQQIKFSLEKLQIQIQNICKKHQKQQQNLSIFWKQDTINDSIFQQAISVQQLKKYLNNQKSILKQLLQLQTQQKKNYQQNRLHSLMKQKQLQELLQRVQLKQLQKQVKYLSTHVINSSGIIYVPDNSLSQAEQQQTNNKIQLLLDQVQRLVSLEIVCGSSQSNKNNKNSKVKVVNGLLAQQKRLNTVYQMLNAEKDSIGKIQNQLGSYIDMVKQVPVYNTKSKQHTNVRKFKLETQPQNSEIQIIINDFRLQNYSDVVCNRKCEVQQLNAQLKILRNKILKLQ